MELWFQSMFHPKPFHYQESVIVNAFWGPYRYFYSRLQDPSLRIDFVPLSVSGICRNRGGLVKCIVFQFHLRNFRWVMFIS